MSTVWITYAWADNINGDVDFIAQELSNVGIQVKLDRWNIRVGNRLWEQIEEFITSKKHSDAWVLIATQNSLSSEPCKEEFAYALNRALATRGMQYPIIGLFPGAIENALIPAGIKTRLYVSLTDSDWKERIKSAIEGRDPNISRSSISPYSLTVHGDDPLGTTIIEVRPRAGHWSPVFVGVPLGEKEKTKPSLMVGAVGVTPTAGIVLSNFEVVSEDGNWWLVSIQHQATPIQSLYVFMDQLPSKLAFGVANGSPQFLEIFQKTALLVSTLDASSSCLSYPWRPLFGSD
ncbi:MAG: toll/interleukin-1 receptor domain-containing protein [Candidatus Methylumidiphilus sp.]